MRRLLLAGIAVVTLTYANPAAADQVGPLTPNSSGGFETLAAVVIISPLSGSEAASVRGADTINTRFHAVDLNLDLQDFIDAAIGCRSNAICRLPADAPGAGVLEVIEFEG